MWSLALTLMVCSAQPDARLHTLLVGGGPDKSHNQAAIESNIRYMERLLPPGTTQRVLFADGDASNRSVQWLDSGNKIHYRIPELPRLDGPSRLDSVQAELTNLAKDSQAHPAEPVFLYFTGHGSPGRRQNYENNAYDLWGDDGLDVRTLAKAVDAFPRQTPITIVMVECYSGAFANLLFDGGDPSQPLNDHRVCGFFASVHNRMAAGCTPEINEANYRDFTGYFFAALTGTDRVGQPVAGVDYNHNGHVTMDEAFAYAVSHDDSIDTPVCTSELFLRHFVKVSDEAVISTKYKDLLKWASPAQRAALAELSSRLNLTTEDRLRTVYNAVQHNDAQTEDLREVRQFRFERLGRNVALAHFLERSSDRTLRDRYHALLKLEAGNPLASAAAPAAQD